MIFAELIKIADILLDFIGKANVFILMPISGAKHGYK